MGRYEEIKAVFDKFKAAYEELEKVADEEGMDYVNLDFIVTEDGRKYRYPSYHKDGVRYILYTNEIHTYKEPDGELVEIKKGE